MSQQFLFPDDAPLEPWKIDAAEELPAARVVFPEGAAGFFDYVIPPMFRDKIVPGCRVEVPLGRGNRPCAAYCVEVHRVSAAERKWKSVMRVLDERTLLSPTMLRLTQWIAKNYLCPWGQVLQTVLPAGVRGQAGTRVGTFLTLAPAGVEALRLRNHDQLNLTKTQLSILKTLAGAPESGIPPEELARRAKVSQGPIKLLRDRGFIATKKERVATLIGDDHFSPADRTEDRVLNPDQQKALDTLLTLLDPRHPPHTYALPEVGGTNVALLHGVTGSGKTEVYIHIIREVLRRGRQAIVLVPEISLTPQTVRRFRSRFSSVAVLHSHLTDVQRHHEWQRIMRGDVEVVVGARSAVFAPTPRLGVIIMDEEHETSFKQETSPRYHARDVAICRGVMEQAMVILGSATPALESWQNAVDGRYKLVSMPRRVMNRRLPEVRTVDLCVRDPKETFHALGRKMHIALNDCLKAGHQAILLLNRRGHSTHIQCPACGAVIGCPHCDVALTYHRTENLAVCHYCDFQQPAPVKCPECNSDRIRYSGIGTQKLEHEVRARFPKARILRMDTDSMKQRGAHEQALSRFRSGEVDILLGTQMIAKGLDFPNVTLVGVVNADTALHLPDFRAAERTFHLITQVAGRTGRGEKGGEVLVQTFQPENPVIQDACRHDYLAFTARELPLRRKLDYPPFSALARIVVKSPHEELTLAVAKEIAEKIAAAMKAHGCDGRILGPAPCPMPKWQDLYRFHIQLHSPSRERLRDALQQTLDEVKTPEHVQWMADMDPVSMM